MQALQVIEPTPDLLGEVRKMPAMYKESIVEWLDAIGRSMITAALDKTDDMKQLLFINGMRFMNNQIIKHILDITKKEETWYSLLTRQQIKNWKMQKDKK